MNVADQEDYVLVSGRWFRSRSFDGPWEYVAPTALPADFAKISETHPKGAALVSVANTPQAREAVIANTIPQTATVKRSEAIRAGGDGEPQFSRSWARRCSMRSTRPRPNRMDAKTSYGRERRLVTPRRLPPWVVATVVPAVIYTIPPARRSIT
jgi:hypothetical protein